MLTTFLRLRDHGKDRSATAEKQVEGGARSSGLLGETQELFLAFSADVEGTIAVRLQSHICFEWSFEQTFDLNQASFSHFVNCSAELSVKLSQREKSTFWSSEHRVASCSTHESVNLAQLAKSIE